MIVMLITALLTKVLYYFTQRYKDSVVKNSGGV